MSTRLTNRRLLTPTAARRALKRKAKTLKGAYYAVGLEVPPRTGASFSMRYFSVPSAKAGAQALRARLARKRTGMVGELILAIPGTEHSVSLGGYIKRERGRLEPIAGDVARGAIDRGALRR